jgi:hypothetical protein
MKNTQSFIFIHNQEILLECINNNKFDDLPKLKYVFLGSGDTSKLKDIPNIIICRDLIDNIEEYPKLTSYTGWYAIWKNKLYDADYINLFEYDIDLSPTFKDTFEVDSKIEIIGYIPYSIHDFFFMKCKEFSDDIKNSVNNTYNTDIDEYIKTSPLDTIISITSNHTFKKESFEQYMEWMIPIQEDIKNTPKAGHQVERSIMLFYLTNNLNTTVLLDVLSHQQLNSHNQ